MTQNKTLIFRKVPTSLPVAGEHLVVEDRPLNFDEAPPPGGVVVEILYASFDPYLRGRMRGANAKVKSYSQPLELNQPIPNDTLVRVLKSDTPDFEVGSHFIAFLPIAEYARVPNDLLRQVRKIDNPYGLDLELFLGPLGMPGLTARAGLYKIGKPRRGETIFVSSAAGAIGQIVGQVARREGLAVIGSVGSDEKLDFITKEIGFRGFNYKNEKAMDALQRLALDGIDIYFDNVGGEHLEAALANMNIGGRVPLCGVIANCNTPPDQQSAIKGLMQLVSRQITMQGFLVFNPEVGPPYAEEHQEKLQKWISDGSVKTKSHVTEGIGCAADGLIGMLVGRNFGKAVLKVK